MSSSTPTETDALLPGDLRAQALEATEALSDVSLAERYHANPLTTPVEIAGFWLAIVMPFLYVPVLLTGISPTTLVGLLALNVVALVAGHMHRRD